MVDHLDSAMKRLDAAAAGKREARQRSLHYAATPHARDSELDQLCQDFAERMSPESAEPFTAYRQTEGHREERGKWGRISIIPTSHDAWVAVAHGWIIPKLGREEAFFYQQTNMTYWHGLGVTIAGELVFILTDNGHIRIDDGLIGSRFTQDRIHRHSVDDPLVNPSLGPISVGNRCECILKTLSLQYRDESKPTYREMPASGFMKPEYPLFPDQAEKLLEAIAASMAPLLVR